MSSETKTYRFILTPLDKIFFGGEKSPFKEEYFQHSRHLPQQTTVLGLLRYEILKRAGKLGRDKNFWEPLIGKDSWNGTKDQSFGIIKSISPVSILKKSDNPTAGTCGDDLFFFRNPSGLKPVYLEGIKTSFGQESVTPGTLVIFDTGSGNMLKRYDEKNQAHFAEIFTDFKTIHLNVECEEDTHVKNTHGITIPAKGSGIFVEDVRVGITKDYGGQPKEDGYFVMQYWRMMPGYAYSFKASIDTCEEIENWAGSSVVTFGGDSSTYQLEVKEEKMDEMDKPGSVFVLISDACADNSIYNHCDLAITDTVSFRNLKTNVNDTTYTKRPVLKWYRDKESYNTDPGRVLLKKGSILLARQGCECCVARELKQDAFQKIGYNHYKTFNEIPQLP